MSRLIQTKESSARTARKPADEADERALEQQESEEASPDDLESETTNPEPDEDAGDESPDDFDRE